ncbi:phage tail protein [Hyphomicrobium sp. MC8b]|uniref:phage tail protein n=1 Tax=Hyphomicrobium sp. MC8b TaxID=300273 RepID=UPI003919489D
MAAQGPTPMALGGFAFRALGFSFNTQEIDLDTPWAEIEVCYRLTALQWTGPRDDRFAIKGIVFEEEFGGLSSLEGIRASAKSGTPLMLVTFSGKVHGRHAIQRVSQERDAIRYDGLARRTSYSIELRRLEAL